MREEELRELEEKLNKIDSVKKRRTRSEYQAEKRRMDETKALNLKDLKKNDEDENTKEFNIPTKEIKESEMKKRKSDKRKLSLHKIINIISFIFLMTCVIVYGTRFIMLYLENNKTEKTKQIADTIKDDNGGNKNFKNIKGDYYFSGSEVNNYVKYSNMIWRIIRVDSSGNVVISLDSSITSLSKEISEFKGSSTYSWLNKSEDEGTGYFQELLNDTSQYLTYTETCTDDDEDIKNITCKKKTKKMYVTLPSLNDYVNTGGSKSFLNQNSYYYLINNDGDKTWCVDNEGKISTSDGKDVIGIKPVVTIKNITKVKTGNGSKDTPYEIEEEVSSLIGTYVKLDNDIWQVYGEDENNVKLVLNDYIKNNDTEFENKYSRSGYKFDINEYGSLAQYLNGRYLNSLGYQGILEEFEISNGIYNGDYREVMKEKVKTKVGILSIGDVIINPEASEYYFATGSGDGKMVYYNVGSSKLDVKGSSNMMRVLPTISIKKSLVLEHGTKEKPYEVVYEKE